MPQQLPTKYPHLLPEDALLWNNYIEQFSPTHTTFMYDVPVGEGRDPGTDFPENIRTMAIQLSKRRIDVVGISADGIDIFELTQVAGLRAAGQCIVYPFLLKLTWNLTIPITTTVICRSCPIEIKETLLQHSIRLIIIPE